MIIEPSKSTRHVLSPRCINLKFNEKSEIYDRLNIMLSDFQKMSKLFFVFNFSYSNGPNSQSFRRILMMIKLSESTRHVLSLRCNTLKSDENSEKNQGILTKLRENQKIFVDQSYCISCYLK